MGIAMAYSVIILFRVSQPIVGYKEMLEKDRIDVISLAELCKSREFFQAGKFQVQHSNWRPIRPPIDFGSQGVDKCPSTAPIGFCDHMSVVLGGSVNQPAGDLESLTESTIHSSYFMTPIATLPNHHLFCSAPPEVLGSFIVSFRGRMSSRRKKVLNISCKCCNSS